MQPVADAVIVTGTVPLVAGSLTPVTTNGADTLAPTGIVTVAGTVALVVSLLSSVTVNGEFVLFTNGTLPLLGLTPRLTVSVVLPLSVIVIGPGRDVSVGCRRPSPE